MNNTGNDSRIMTIGDLSFKKTANEGGNCQKKAPIENVSSKGCVKGCIGGCIGSTEPHSLTSFGSKFMKEKRLSFFANF